MLDFLDLVHLVPHGMLRREHLREESRAVLHLVGQRLKIVVELHLARNQTEGQRILPFRSEPVLYRGLDGPGRPGGGGVSEERRRLNPDEIREVAAVERVECVQRDLDHPVLVGMRARRPQRQQFGDAQIHLGKSGTLSGIARDTDRAVVDAPVSVVVEARCDVERRAGG